MGNKSQPKVRLEDREDELKREKGNKNKKAIPKNIPTRNITTLLNGHMLNVGPMAEYNPINHKPFVVGQRERAYCLSIYSTAFQRSLSVFDFLFHE